MEVEVIQGKIIQSPLQEGLAVLAEAEAPQAVGASATGGNGGFGGGGGGGGGSVGGASGGTGGQCGFGASNGGTGGSTDNQMLMGAGGNGAGFGGGVFVMGSLTIKDSIYIPFFGNSAAGGDSSYGPAYGKGLGNDFFLYSGPDAQGNPTQGTLTFDISNTLKLSSPIQGNVSELGDRGLLVKQNSGTLTMSVGEEASAESSIDVQVSGVLNKEGVPQGALELQPSLSLAQTRHFTSIR